MSLPYGEAARSAIRSLHDSLSEIVEEPGLLSERLRENALVSLKEAQEFWAEHPDPLGQADEDV